MRTTAIAIAAAAAAVLGTSVFNRAFGAYGYTPHADDAIALALLALFLIITARQP